MQSTTLIFKHFVDQCLWINAKFELKCRGFYMNDKRWCIVWTHLNFHSKTLQEWFRFCVVLGVFRRKVRFLESNGHFELKYAYCSFIEELNIKTLGAEINEFSATLWKSRSLRWTQMLKFDMKQHQMEIQWNWECNENQNAMKFKMHCVFMQFWIHEILQKSKYSMQINCSSKLCAISIFNWWIENRSKFFERCQHGTAVKSAQNWIIFKNKQKASENVENWTCNINMKLLIVIKLKKN